jgi:ATP synthase F1 delta subunit
MIELKTISQLTRRYATAYFNVFGSHINDEQRDRLEKIATFLQTKKDFFHLLQLSFINGHDIKKDFWKKFIIDKHLPEHLIELSNLLIEHNRINLFPFIMQKIITLYDMNDAHITFYVFTSCHLSEALRKDIESMLAQTTKATIRCIYHTDTSLIAGIRIQSYGLLWEHSIRKQIQAINHALNT